LIPFYTVTSSAIFKFSSGISSRISFSYTVLVIEANFFIALLKRGRI